MPPETRVRFDGSTLLARQVLEELSVEPMTCSALAHTLGAPVRDLERALDRLEAADRVVACGSNWSVA